MSLHEWLQRFIKQHSITYTQLADATGLNRGSLNKYIHGQHVPNVTTLAKIAVGLAKLTEQNKDDLMLELVALCLQ